MAELGMSKEVNLGALLQRSFPQHVSGCTAGGAVCNSQVVSARWVVCLSSAWWDHKVVGVAEDGSRCECTSVQIVDMKSFEAV